MNRSVVFASAWGALGLVAGSHLAPPSADPAAAALAPRTATQEPEGTEDGLPIGWRQRQQRQLNELRASLIGSWSLVGFRHVTNDLSSVGVTGYLGLTDDLLTFFVHTVEPATRVFDDPRRFQAGVHHWRISEAGRLQTSTVISHSNFATGALEFEPGMTPREYEISLSDNELQLIRVDGSVLSFRRLQPQTFPEAVLQGLGAPTGPSQDEESSK